MKAVKMNCQRCRSTFVSVDKDSGCLNCGSSNVKVKGVKMDDGVIVSEFYSKKPY